MTGIIILWYGAVAEIPIGWQLCDGTNGTPDLRDNFVISAGPTYAIDSTGGNSAHVHVMAYDMHLHMVPGGGVIPYALGFFPTYSPVIVTGNADSANNLSPYHALCFIQKMAA